LELLQQRQERLEQQKLKEKMERLVNDEVYQSLTSRLKKPTTSLTRLDRDKSKEKRQQQEQQRLVNRKKVDEEPRFKPRISKNTDQLIENRKKRLQQHKQPAKSQTMNKQNGDVPQLPAVKASDKYLIQKFNKEFDLVRDQLIDQQAV